MAFDYKKEYKEFYMPKNKPGIIEIPKMNYIAVRGKGNPNEENGEYKNSIGLLYGIAFTIKMSYKGTHKIEGFFEYVVPPLEGLWWQENTQGLDYARKEDMHFISMIRLPDFVTKEDFEWAVREATKKKKQDFSKVEFFLYDEGLCVQCMHIGSYDDEPTTIDLMHDYMKSNGYELDITDTRYHHEIYLSDPRKCDVSRLKTVVRHPMRSYMKKILIHGSGHKASSWEKTVAHMENRCDILCPELCSLLNGKTASYANLYDSFARYCNAIDGPIHLCGISLGGILALNYALDFPEKTKTLVLIGTPYKIPKLAFAFQNMIFRFLPESVFENMAFNKKDTFLLGNSMKSLDFGGRLQNIKCPVLVICGEKDTANRKAAHFLSENMKNAELKIIENTGHIVNEEAPGILAEILNEYYGLHRE